MWFKSKKDFPKEVILLEKFQKEFEGLLSQTCYIAKSMYQNLLKDFFRQQFFVKSGKYAGFFSEKNCYFPAALL